MSRRRIIWAAVAAVALGSSIALDRLAGAGELAVPTALLLVGIGALLAEATSARKPVRPTPPAGARPADGIVEVGSMAEVEGVPNPESSRFRRFVRVLEAPGGPRAVRTLPGARPTLLGRVALISMFIGRDGRDWTDEEVARAHSAIERAGDWIEREAIRHSAAVNVALADAYLQVRDDEVDEVEVAFAGEGDDVGPMEANASTKAVVAVSRAAATLGFVDVVDLVGRIDPRVVADARVWLIHVLRAGRSLAIASGESGIPGVGLAVCFSREASFPEPLDGPGRVDPTTVAHELLHLFGASDKYGVPLRSFPTGSVTSADIMRLSHDRLSRMTIDPLTATEVGWSPAPPSSRSTKDARR